VSDHDLMPRLLPRPTKWELAFPTCLILSFSFVLCLIFLADTDRVGEDIWIRAVHVWLASIVVAAIVGSVALMAGRRLLMIIPFLLVGYYLSLFSIILMTPYSNVETLEQLLGAQLTIYAAAFAFWLALLKVPLPRFRKSR